MLTLFEGIGFMVLVAVSVVGFAAAVAWSFAVWFSGKS